LQKIQREYKQNRENAFCLGAYNCTTGSFFGFEMVDIVAASVFSDVAPSN
jgi:hypothetical protein